MAVDQGESLLPDAPRRKLRSGWKHRHHGDSSAATHGFNSGLHRLGSSQPYRLASTSRFNDNVETDTGGEFTSRRRNIAFRVQHSVCAEFAGELLLVPAAGGNSNQPDAAVPDESHREQTHHSTADHKHGFTWFGPQRSVGVHRVGHWLNRGSS